MAEDFNPYHVWLSIPPEEQPPNHYRLLGLPLFETNADVIDNAADRQMAHLRTIQVGKHGELSQRLLNEVAAARVCLLDSKKRAPYDQQLRAKLPATPGTAPSAVSGSAIQRQPPRRPGPSPTAAAAPAASVPVAAALPQAANDWDDLLGDPAAKPASRSGGNSAGANSVRAGAAKRAANNRNMSIGVAAAVLLIAAAGIGWFALNGSSSDGTLVFDWPSDEKADATVTVDDVPLPVPANGPWEYHGPAGSHHIVALRPAYKLDANVALAAGQKQTAPADWKPKAVLALSWPLSERAGAELKIDGRTHAVTQHDPLEIAVEPGRHRIQITRTGFAPIVMTATVAADGRELTSVTAPPTTGRLVFDWPADQRKDAELAIDGHSQTIAAGSEDAPIELTLDPGRHVVRITRTGFEAFKQTVDLVAGANETVKPTWTPAQTVASDTSETQAPVKTPTEQPAKKLPVPPAAEQEKIAKQLDDLYKSSHSGSKDPAKAQELYDLAAKASSTERYVLLVKGAELAAAAGDLNLSLPGVDSLDAEFEIDAMEAKQKLLDRFVSAGKAEQVDAAIPIAEQLMDQAVAADRYALATAFSMTASRAATKSRSPTRKEIDERLSRRRHDIHILEPFFAAAKTAQETLAKDPADTEANSNLGRWLCFYKGDWSAGLPMLAKGSDETPMSLAKQELKTPTDAEQQAHLADAWWDVASKESGIARDSIHLHAGDIYQTALPNLTSALRKAAIEKRLAEIADLKLLPAATATVANTFPIGQWVDVLRLIDLDRDCLSGSWRRSGTELVTGTDLSRAAMPLTASGSYDLQVEFTRASGQGDVVTMLLVGSHRCFVQLSGYAGIESGLASYNGHDGSNPGDPIAVRPGRLENGHRYRLLARVRTISDRSASVDVSLDGKPYLPHWQGDPAILSNDGTWSMPNTPGLGIGSYNSKVTFYSVRLRMVSGHASRDPAAAKADIANPSPEVSGHTATASGGKVPSGNGVDLLAAVDTKRDSIEGHWERRGSTVFCNDWGSGGDRRFLAFPREIAEARYELRMEFSRDRGDDCVAVGFPVGERGAEFVLSDVRGKFSGLEKIDGHALDDPANPTARSPSTLENGRRYGVRIVVSVQRDTAKVNCFLDGDELVAWKGKVDSLDQNKPWKTDPHRVGVGEWNSPSTIYGATVRALK